MIPYNDDTIDNIDNMRISGTEPRQWSLARKKLYTFVPEVHVCFKVTFIGQFSPNPDKLSQ